MDRSAEIESALGEDRPRRGRPARGAETRESVRREIGGESRFEDERAALLADYENIAPIYFEEKTRLFPVLPIEDGYVVRWLRVRDNDRPVSIAEYTGYPLYATPVIAEEISGFQAWTAQMPEILDQGGVIAVRDCVAFKISKAIALGVAKADHQRAMSQIAAIQSPDFLLNGIRDYADKVRMSALLKQDGVMRGL